MCAIEQQPNNEFDPILFGPAARQRPQHANDDGSHVAAHCTGPPKKLETGKTSPRNGHFPTITLFDDQGRQQEPELS